MRFSSSITMFAMLGVLTIAGCAGTGAVAGDDTPSPTIAPSATAPARAADGHNHHHDDDVPLEISLAPRCVTPGDEMTVTVQTAPRTGVLYLAYYSDGENGASEPIGAGYGGNGGGYAQDDGSFQESWTVSESAPAGPGWLKILTVSGNEDTSTTFAVLAPDEEDC